MIMNWIYAAHFQLNIIKRALQGSLFNHVGEIACQQNKDAAGSRFQSIADLTQPTQAMNVGCTAH